MKIHRIISTLALVITIVGLVGLAPFAWSFFDEQLTGATPNTGATVAMPKLAPVAKKPVTISGKPIRIVVPSLGLDLAIIDGAYDSATGKWTLTKDKAQFALPTKPANNKAGNTLIYGHSTAPVFERLHKIANNAEAIIYTHNGHVLKYRYTNSEVVDPQNTDIFNYEGKPRLTLQTCTGMWFENRKFFYFRLASAK